MTNRSLTSIASQRSSDVSQNVLNYNQPYSIGQLVPTASVVEKTIKDPWFLALSGVSPEGAVALTRDANLSGWSVSTPPINPREQARIFLNPQNASLYGNSNGKLLGLPADSTNTGKLYIAHLNSNRKETPTVAFLTEEARGAGGHDSTQFSHRDCTNHEPTSVGSNVRYERTISEEGFLPIDSPEIEEILKRNKLYKEANINGLNPEFRRRLATMLKAAESEGVSMQIGSTKRTIEQQRALYERYLRGKGPLAAKPNPSAPHVSGRASDLSSNNKLIDKITDHWVHRNAAKFGLYFPLLHAKGSSQESWHIQLDEKVRIAKLQPNPDRTERAPGTSPSGSNIRTGTSLKPNLSKPKEPVRKVNHQSSSTSTRIQ